MSITNIKYTTVLYTVKLAEPAEGSPVTAIATEDIPGGAMVSLISTGAKACDGATDGGQVAGFALKPTRQGSLVTIIERGILENTGTSLSLTPGAAVWCDDNGVLSGSRPGTAPQAGIALGANKIRVRL